MAWVPENPDVFTTPEAAACGDIPSRFVNVLGVGIRGDEADVWMLTTTVRRSSASRPS
jgi:hypothetical protein